jgi:hypothetical protein
MNDTKRYFYHSCGSGICTTNVNTVRKCNCGLSLKEFEVTHEQYIKIVSDKIEDAISVRYK